MDNQVQLIGNVGVGPEITKFTSGAKRVRLTLATNEYYSSKSGEKTQRTFWHKLYAWGPTATYISKAGKKGTQLAITGKLVNKAFLSKDGKPKSFTAIEVKNAVAL